MIGIFDSGSGGLTVLTAIRKVLPSCDVVYFGDIKNAPYGSKSPEELSLLTVSAIKFLKGRGADRIVSACNSVSASLALSLFDLFNISASDMIEMVGPTVAYCAHFSGRIFLCATPATIRSNIYQNGFHMLGKTIEPIAIPGLASAIEFGEGKEQKLITGAFKEIKWRDNDMLILACTHYPLILPLFKEIIPKNVLIFDPAEAVAERVEKQFWPQEVQDGKTQFFISKESEQFRALIPKLFAKAPYTLEVVG